MEQPALSDEELIEEALAIIDSVDIKNLTATTSVSRLSTAEEASSTATADDLLNAAIEAVRTSFPQSNSVWGGHKQKSRDNPLPAMGEERKHDQVPTDNFPVQASTDQERSDSANALHALPATGDTTKPSPANKRRKRIREQLIQLRAVVKKMENHVETLKSPRSSCLEALETEDRNENVRLLTDENNSKQANVLGEAADEAFLWRNIAMQQFRARRRAEHQNAELRESLAAQIRLSKEVEGLLQAQQPHSSVLLDHAQSLLSQVEGPTESATNANGSNAKSL